MRFQVVFNRPWWSAGLEASPIAWGTLLPRLCTPERPALGALPGGQSPDEKRGSWEEAGFKSS